MKTELIFVAIIFNFGNSFASFGSGHNIVSPEDKSLLSYVSNYYVGDPLENSLASNVSNRDDRVVAFLRIRIPGTVCDTGVTGMSEGYCDGVASCLSYAGRITGICKNGIGVCCIVTRRCGRTIANRIAYFTNEGYKFFALNKSPCVATVRRHRVEVTQLRLDFINLNLQQPTAAGACQTERLIISGSAATLAIPVLCGTLTGSHIYVPYTASGDPITINVTLNDVNTPFEIKVTQITPEEIDAAPSGCLQYYNTPTGVVESFNYQGMILLGINYRFCLPSSLQSVTWTAENFQISDNPGTTMCRSASDYMTFSDATNLDLPPADRVQDTLDFCGTIGNNFPMAGIESWSNFVTYNYDAKALGTDLTLRKWFRLTYVAVF